MALIQFRVFKQYNMSSNKVASLLVLVTALYIIIIIDAQRCMDTMCGSIICPLISETGCSIKSQVDCADGEIYLDPRSICDCCGACLNRSLNEDAPCDYSVMNEHTASCAVELCCSNNELCVKKTSEYGPP